MSDLYDRWIKHRRDVDLADDLADRVLAEITKQQTARRHLLVALLARSVAVRVVVCGAALAAGSLPYLFLAALAQGISL